MRKLTIALGITALSFGAATNAAPDAGGVCIDFDFFCDGLELFVGPNGLIAGSWVNTDCAGTDVSGLRGSANGATTVDVICDNNTVSCPGGFTWLFKLERSSSTFDMYGSDGVNPPFLQQFNSPYTVSAGPCAFENDEGFIPSSLSR